MDFDDWFENLQMLLADEGINFQDKDSVKEDFDKGRDMFDVFDEIKQEYEA